MALENATYIADLVPANPAQTDPIQQGQNHLNLIKKVLQNQFPNLGEAAVSVDAAGLNALGAALQEGVLTVTPDGTTQGAEIVLDGQVDGSGNPVAGSVILSNSAHAGMGALTISTEDPTGTAQPGTVTIDGIGNVTASGALNGTSIEQNGIPLIPVGSATGCFVAMWSGAVASIPAGWALCDGGTHSGVVVPDLRDRFIIGAGHTYTPAQTGGSVGSGATTTSSAGSHNHTGATGAAGSHSHSGATGLTAADLQPHSHGVNFSDPGHAHTVSGVLTTSGGGKEATGGGVRWQDGASVGTSGSGTGISISIQSAGAGGGHQHSISVDGNHTNPISTDGAHTHTVTVPTLPPFYALCFIARVQ